MPRIPIRDIPNAPQPIPQPTGGNLSRVNLGHAQSLLQQSEISQGAFDGPARGMQALAAGIGSIAGASDKFAQAALHLQEQVEENQVWKAMDALGEAHNAVAQDIASNPTKPQEYGPKMQKGLDDAYQKIIANKDLTERARLKIEQRYNRFRIDAVGKMQLAGVKAIFDQNKAFAKADFDHAVEAGDTERAVEIVQQNSGKLFFAEEADGLIHHARQQGDVLRVLQTMPSDPDKAEEMVNSESDTPNIPAVMRLRLLDQVDTQRRKNEAENWESLVDGIANQTIASPEDVAAIFGEKFAIKNASKIKAAFAANPDPVKQKEAWLSISDDIGGLDPTDPKTKNAVYDIMKRISSEIADPDIRQSLKSELNNAAKGTDEGMLNSQVTETLKLAEDAGIFGEWSDKRIKKGKKEDYRNKEDAINKKHQIKIDADRWIKKNPNAKSDELDAWLQNRISRDIKMAEPGWWGKLMPTWLGGAPKTTREPGSRQVGERIDEKLMKHEPRKTSDTQEVSLPGGHKVTSYGYGGDSTPDSNSRKGIGAWDNRLEDGLSFAASPDVEAMLRENGVGKNDLVELTLDNGKRVTVRFSDRTANDVTARKLGLEPLRGRWDIYNKKGLHPFDDIAVKSFRKVEA